MCSGALLDEGERGLIRMHIYIGEGGDACMVVACVKGKLQTWAQAMKRFDSSLETLPKACTTACQSASACICFLRALGGFFRFRYAYIVTENLTNIVYYTSHWQRVARDLWGRVITKGNCVPEYSKKQGTVWSVGPTFNLTTSQRIFWFVSHVYLHHNWYLFCPSSQLILM